MQKRFAVFNDRTTGKEDWLTPPEILRALGEFDLDPCSPVGRPWDTAKKHYTIHDNGLQQPWDGRVWLNPPYGKETGKWLDRLAVHGRGTALIFARTDTEMFFDSVWGRATGMLFLRGRLNFYTREGRRGSNAGAPSVLVAYGQQDSRLLAASGLAGHFIDNASTTHRQVTEIAPFAARRAVAALPQSTPAQEAIAA